MIQGIMNVDEIKIKLQEDIQNLSKERLTFKKKIDIIELWFKYHKVVRSVSPSC